MRSVIVTGGSRGLGLEVVRRLAADGYRAVGKLDLALPLFEETLKLSRAKLGQDHLLTLNSMNNLASYAARLTKSRLPRSINA